MAELVTAVPGLEPFVPRCRFVLLDGQRAATEAGLAHKNFVAALFALEKSRTPADMRRVVQLLIEWLAAPEFASLRRAFALWLCEAVAARQMTGDDIPETAELAEVNIMLNDRVEAWLDESYEKGKAEGKAALLLRQARLRFGPVPDAVAARIVAETDPDRLDTWAERLVFANTLDAIFR